MPQGTSLSPGQTEILTAHASWEAAPQSTVSFSVPNTWQAGSIWVSFPKVLYNSGANGEPQARRDCDFSDTNPATQCADGGCAGGLECSGTVRSMLI